MTNGSAEIPEGPPVKVYMQIMIDKHTAYGRRLENISASTTLS